MLAAHRPRSSTLTIWGIALVYLSFFHFYGRWQQTVVGGGDPWGYYAYLPATLIHHDLATLDKTVQVCKEYRPWTHQSPDHPLGLLEAHALEDGRQVIKYTMGLAFLILPFFLLAHFLALVGGWTADGFSEIYIYCLYLWSLTCSLAGLFVLRAVLGRHFGDILIAWVLMAIGLGTNLLYFAVYNSPMAHAGLFFLYACLLWLISKFFERPNGWWAVGIGLCCGWITLIRPTEVIVVLLPLLWGLGQGKFIQRHIALYGLAMLAFLLMGLPQMLYWQWLTGDWLYFSYGEESFNFLHPRILHGLIGFDNGWLVYTPIMLFGVLGVPWLWQHKRLFWPFVIFMSLHIYLTYSWWCWNYINGFGSRPMVETYILWAFPMAYFVRFLWRRKWGLWFSWATLCGGIWLNFFQLWQFDRGILWSEDNNLAYYRASFGKTSVDANDLAAYDLNLLQPNPFKLKRKQILAYHNFEDSSQYVALSDSVVFAGKYAQRVDSTNQYSTELLLQLDQTNIKGGDWLRANLWALTTASPATIYDMSMIAFSFDYQWHTLYWLGVRVENKISNPDRNLWGNLADRWGEISVFVPVPRDLPPGTKLKVHVWNPTQHTLFLDELSIEWWTTK